MRVETTGLMPAPSATPSAVTCSACCSGCGVRGRQRLLHNAPESTGSQPVQCRDGAAILMRSSSRSLHCIRPQELRLPAQLWPGADQLLNERRERFCLDCRQGPCPHSCPRRAAVHPVPRRARAGPGTCASLRSWQPSRLGLRHKSPLTCSSAAHSNPGQPCRQRRVAGCPAVPLVGVSVPGGYVGSAKTSRRPVENAGTTLFKYIK